MLDVNTRSDPGWVRDGTLEWLEAQLAEAKAAGERVIAVSHQNLYAHNPLFTDGYLIGNGGALHSLYTEYGVLCNTLYFAGRGDLIEWDEALASGWDGHGYMIPVYLGTIRSDAGTNHTHLSWSFAGSA